MDENSDAPGIDELKCMNKSEMQSPQYINQVDR